MCSPHAGRNLTIWPSKRSWTGASKLSMAASIPAVTGAVYLQIKGGIYMLFVTWCAFPVSDVVIAKVGAGVERWPYGVGSACQERWPSLALSDHLLSVTFLERKERWFVVIAFLLASLQDILYLATHLHPSVIIRAEDPTLYVECTPRILYWWKLLAIGGLLNLWFILCIHYQREIWEFLTWPFGCKEVIEYVNVHFGQLVISPSCHYICEFVKIIRPRL